MEFYLTVLLSSVAQGESDNAYISVASAQMERRSSMYRSTRLELFHSAYDDSLAFLSHTHFNKTVTLQRVSTSVFSSVLAEIGSVRLVGDDETFRTRVRRIHSTSSFGMNRPSHKHQSLRRAKLVGFSANWARCGQLEDVEERHTSRQLPWTLNLNQIGTLFNVRSKGRSPPTRWGATFSVNKCHCVRYRLWHFP